MVLLYVPDLLSLDYQCMTLQIHHSIIRNQPAKVHKVTTLKHARNWKRENLVCAGNGRKNKFWKISRKQIWSPHRYQKAESLCFMSRVGNQTKKSRRQFWLQSPISYLRKSAFRLVLTRRLETVSYLLPSFKRHFPWCPKLVTIQNG